MEHRNIGFTQPQICKQVGISRARGERILVAYRERLPKPERVGITRVWAPEIVDLVRGIVDEESRKREARR